MNKIIKTVKKEDKSFDSSALRRANANIEVYSPEELAHFGVMGMRWGVRKDRSSGGIRSAHQKKLDNKKVELIERAERQAAGGLRPGEKKVTGFRSAHQKALDKKFVESVKKKNQVDDEKSLKKAAKKEMKAIRGKIVTDFSRRSDAELAAHEKEFKAKYGNQSLKTSLKNLGSKAGREANIKRSNDYSNMLTKRMEKMLNDVAKTHLDGTNYKITAVQGFNDFAPDFIITNGTDSVKHSDILEHADISWKMDVEWGDDGFVKSMNIPEDFLDIKDEEVAFVNMPDEDGDDQDENDDEG